MVLDARIENDDCSSTYWGTAKQEWFAGCSPSGVEPYEMAGRAWA